MRRIVKVGGSLLSRTDYSVALSRWLATQPPGHTMFVIGGGRRVDFVRHRDRYCPGDPVEVHWQCVDLLQVTFEIVSKRFGEWKRIDSPQQLAAELEWGDRTIDVDAKSRPALVSVRSFYGRGFGIDLPMDWTTTSDSIAAALAIHSEADELVLLKSCDVNPLTDVQVAAWRGIVDGALPQLIPRVRSIRIEKLPSVRQIP